MTKRPADDGRESAAVPLAVAGAAILEQQFARMQANEAGARLGEDVEALHQMRVAIRRLRSALGIFVPDEVRETFAPVKVAAREIARALGAVRDLDVLRDELRARTETVPADALALEALLAALERLRDKRREELRAVLDGPATRQFREAFPPAVNALKQAADPRVTVGNAAPRLIRRRQKKVMRSADRLRTMSALELHQVRLRCKRLRDICEFFKPWFERRVEPTIEITTAMQDTLGTVHEGDVAPHSLQALIGADLVAGSPAPFDGYGLARATLALIHDRQQEREALLVRYLDQLAKLRELSSATKLKAT